MADLALAGGVGAGLLSFANSYQRQQQLDQTNALNNKYADMASQRDSAGLLGQGMQHGLGNDVEYNSDYQKIHDLSKQNTASDAQYENNIRDPDSDESEQLRNTAKQLSQQYKVGMEGSITDDMSGKYVRDQILPTLNQAAKNKELENVANLKGGYQVQAGQARIDQSQDRLSQRVHAGALKELQDPTITQLQTSYQNLATAKNNFVNGGATPQDFAELQQAVRANLGIKGSSGVGERQEDYLKSLGINVDKAKQFITGDPQDVSKTDPALVHQMMGLVDLEMKNKQGNAAAQISQKVAGHASFYKRPNNADIAGDYADAVNQKRAQFGLPTIDQNGQAQQGQGLLGQPGPQSSNGQQYTPDVISYANSHQITPDQALAIKIKRTAAASATPQPGNGG